MIEAKLNRRSSTKICRGKGAGGCSELCIVSGRGTLVNNLEMSKEQKKTEKGSEFEVLMMSTKVKESNAGARIESENRFEKTREMFGQLVLR